MRDTTVSDELRDFREQRLKTIRENKEFVKQWTEEHLKQHEQNMNIRRQREKHDLRFELTMKEKNTRKQQIATETWSNDMQQGIQDFEITLQRLGKDPKTQESKVETKKELILTMEEKKLQAGLAPLT